MSMILGLFFGLNIGFGVGYFVSWYIAERNMKRPKIEYDTSDSTDKEIELSCFPLRNSFEHHVEGSISIAHVYNKALTPTEIKHLYKTGDYTINNKYRYSPIGI